MADHPEKPPFYTGRGHRIVTAAFGLFLAGIGIYAIFLAGTDPLFRIPGGIAIFTIGCNALWAAYTATESWISRIGPLP